LNSTTTEHLTEAIMRSTIQRADLPPVLQAERDTYREHNDCTVVSVAVAAELSYSEAHEFVARLGRKPRRGFHFVSNFNNRCHTARIKGIDFRLGKYKVTRVRMPWRGPHFHGVTLAQFLRDFPKGRFIVVKRGHAFVVIDGKVLNLTHSGVRSRITNLWYLTEATS
jgi:hypothetical protein